MAESEFDLRCTCSRRPLLARFGHGTDGRLYVHAKVFKGRRLYHEAVYTGGTVRIRCRECLRWNAVKIRQPDDVRVRLEELPAEIQGSMLDDAVGA